MVTSQLIPLPRRRRGPKRVADARPAAASQQHQDPQRRRGSRTGLRGLEPLQRQIACRAINEQIREISDRFAAGEQVEFVCECPRPGCFELVKLSPQTYEEIRRFGNRFFAKPGHTDDENETVAHGQIVIAEKDRSRSPRGDPRRSSPERLSVSETCR